MFYNVSAAYGALPPRTALPEAEDLLSKGLALDENSPSLHSTLGMLRVFQWRWAEAEQAYKRAISLEPTNAFPHMAYPILCSFLGRHEEALLHAGKAVELEPLDLMTNFRLLQAKLLFAPLRRGGPLRSHRRRADARLALHVFFAWPCL